APRSVARRAMDRDNPQVAPKQVAQSESEPARGRHSPAAGWNLSLRPGGPPSWHGSRASPASDAIHVDRGWGWTWIPAADGYDERGTGGKRQTHTQQTQRTAERLPGQHDRRI